MVLNTDGLFTFSTPIPYGGSYDVTILLPQPSGLICKVFHGTGSPVTADVTSVRVICYAQSAYVADTVGNMRYCTLNNIDGTFNTCTTTPSSGAPAWLPAGVALATMDDAMYAYVADIVGSVYKCTLNTDGTFNTCTAETPAIPPFLGSFAISFSTVNNTQYAYISTDIPSGVSHCTINSTSGELNTCTPTPLSAPVWNPVEIAFATISSIQYAYVADGTPMGGAIYQCTLNYDGTFNNCLTTPVSPPAWAAPTGIALITVNGSQYAYIADVSTGMYLCEVYPTGGLLHDCIPTATPAPGQPNSVTIGTVNGTRYAYVSGTNVYRCEINPTTAALENCLVTPAASPFAAYAAAIMN